MPERRTPTSVLLSARSRQQLDALKDALGVSGSAVLALALDALAEREGVAPPPGDPPVPRPGRKGRIDDPPGPIPTGRTPPSPWGR